MGVYPGRGKIGHLSIFRYYSPSEEYSELVCDAVLKKIKGIKDVQWKNFERHEKKIALGFMFMG